MDNQLSILGGCVSRDPFSYCTTPLKINYIARQSIATLFSLPTEGRKKVLPILQEGGSKFERRNMQHDLLKDTFQTFPRDVPLLLDLTGERLDLARLCDNALYTFSPAAVHYSNLNELAEEKIHPLSRRKIELLNHYLPLFVEKLREFDCIIIHKAFFVSDFSPYYINCNDFNKLLTVLYDYIIRSVPNCIVIEIPDYLRIAQTHNHRWGVGPTHYILEYYLRFLCEFEYKTSYSIVISPYIQNRR